MPPSKASIHQAPAKKPPGATTQLFAIDNQGGNSRPAGGLSFSPGSATSSAPRNETGLPDHIKSGAEHHSGISLNDVRVHYNSPKPATMQAHAYTQGNQIHVAPGQERYLGHETWHAVQQKQNRVTPNRQLKGLNDSPVLEKEADVMGERIARPINGTPPVSSVQAAAINSAVTRNSVTQKQSYTSNTGQNFSWNGNSTVVGKTMEAWLDPSYPVQGEEANLNKEQDNMMKAIRTKYPEMKPSYALVKGHLLNANVGGKAHNNNLFPITKTANSEHLYCAENCIKNKLWHDNQPTYYKVDVGGSADIKTRKHSFVVSWGNWNMSNNNVSNMQHVPIPSDFGDLDTSSGYATQSAMMTSDEAVDEDMAMETYSKVGSMDDDAKALRQENYDNPFQNSEFGAGKKGQTFKYW